MHHNNSFERKYKRMQRQGDVFGIVFIAIFVLCIGAGVYNVATAPDCQNGMLIYDDVGRIVCVPVDHVAVSSRRAWR